MPLCANCGSSFVRPAEPTAWGRLRCRFTGRRPFACWHCGWSGWLTRAQILAGTPSELTEDDRTAPTRQAEPRAR